MINLIQNCVRNSSNFGPQVLALSPVQRTDKTTSTKAKALGAIVAGVSEVAVFHPVDTIIKGKMNNTTILSGKHTLNIEALRRLYSGVGFGLTYKITQRVYKMAGRGRFSKA